MGGVLQRAATLCAAKLVCNLFFLPSLTCSYSPVSFCCCCLLIFTDFLVTGFLGFLCIFEMWLTDLAALGDVIALRFLLFLSHMYGAVLLLITPLIAAETLCRLLWLLSDVTHRTVGPTAGPNGQCCSRGKRTVGQQKDCKNPEKDKRLFHVLGYLCCLSVWVTVALNVREQWKREEMLSAVCLLTTNSLIRCLPNLFSPIPIAVTPCWGMALLFVFMLLLTTSAVLHRHWAPAQMERTHTAKHGVNNNCDSCWPDRVPVLSAPSKPRMSVSDPAQCVDPEKTENSCTVHRAYFWNSVQMSARHHGDFVLISSACLPAERGGQEHQGTKTGTPLTFTTEEHAECRSQHRWRQWGFPCLGVNVMIGLVGVLSIFVLPLSLSVNILLIRTIETLLETCLQSLVSCVSNKIDTKAAHNETLV